MATSLHTVRVARTEHPHDGDPRGIGPTNSGGWSVTCTCGWTTRRTYRAAADLSGLAHQRSHTRPNPDDQIPDTPPTPEQP